MRNILLGIVCFCTLLLTLAVPGAMASKRVALIVGNSTYEHAGRLGNPSNDARAIASALERLGFDTVILKEDMDYRSLRLTLKDFSRDASAAALAIIYFAGHGIEVAGQNYLIPTDAKLAEASDVDYEAIPLSSVLGAVEGAKQLRLVILDACRDNPFQSRMSGRSSTRSIGRGLARVEPQGNMLVAFAAKEGTVALDGGGTNSPFTEALLAHLEIEGLEIGFLFRKVRDSVMEATGSRQEPFIYGSLGGQPIYLKHSAESTSAPAAKHVSIAPAAPPPASVASKESEPGYDETVSFISAVAANCNEWKSHWWETGQYKHMEHTRWLRTSLAFESGKKLVVEEDTYKSWTTNHARNKSYSFDDENILNARVDLSELDPRVVAEDNKIKLKCTKANCISWIGKYKKRNDPKSGQKTEREFTFCNADTAERIAKALSHAIKLAGGKAAPF